MYGIDATSGTAFYDFSSIPDHTAFKEAYRARLDAPPWDEAERARIIDEVLLGYHRNTRVLVELSRWPTTSPPTMWSPPCRPTRTATTPTTAW